MLKLKGFLYFFCNAGIYFYCNIIQVHLLYFDSAYVASGSCENINLQADGNASSFEKINIVI